MRRTSTRAAVVISALAAVLSVAGVAVAEVLRITSSAQLGTSVVTSSKILIRQVSEAKLSRAVRDRIGEETAFAHVRADGSLDGARSANITRFNIVRVGDSGAYCFGLDFAPRVVLVTKEENAPFPGASAADDAVAAAEQPGSGFCNINHRDVEIGFRALRETGPRAPRPGQSVSDWRREREFTPIPERQGFFVLFLR